MRAKEVVDRLEAVIGACGAPIRLVSVVEAELSRYFCLPNIQAAEQAERLASSVAREIAGRITNSEREGLSPVLAIMGATSDTVAGFCYVLSDDTEKIATIKRQRMHIAALIKKIRSISFSQFETFGKRVLDELGAGGTKVTKHGNDQGIDFFGEFTLGQLHGLPVPFLKIAHDIRLLLVGHAKHYPNNSVGPDVVRELIGAISLARTKTFSLPGTDIFETVNMRPFSPVVALLFTTGEFTKGAVRLAESAGIIAKSGMQLAVFLADCGVGVRQHDGASVFDETEFDSWLQR